MLKLTLYGTLLLVLLTPGRMCFASASDSTIMVPLRFHILADLSMTKDGLDMQSWITEKDARQTILPEINRIWRKANIIFTIDQVVFSKAAQPPDQEALIASIVKAQRDEKGRSDPKRIKHLSKLIRFDFEEGAVINIYLIPYLGEASQGHARRKLRRIFIGQWSDKASRARKPPARFQLTEQGSFKQGSLSRTVAHELGHILGLKHPDQTTQTVYGLLMGGKHPGYNLTAYEITLARKQAVAITQHP